MSAKRFSVRKRWERIKTVPGLGRDVGAVTGLIVLGVVTAIVIASQLSSGLPWSSRSVVKAEFAAVPGVNPNSSATVTIAGVKVGKIASWDATNHGTAVLTLDIDAGHTIYDNARAVLRPKNPVNDMSVEINPGGPPGHPLGQDGLIRLNQTQRPVQADEILKNLDPRAQQAVTDLLTQSDVALARAPEQLPGGLQATDDTLLKMRPVLNALQTRRDKLSQLVTALSQISTATGQNDQRIARLVDATQQTLGALASNDGALRASLGQLPGLSDDLRNALTGTQELTKQLNPTLDNLKRASTDLPPALQRFQGTVGQVGATVDAAKPVVAKARPVVADLRPLVANVDDSLADIRPITSNLDQDTRTVTSYLTDIRAFVYNTNSVFGAGDAQGSIIRGHLVVPPPGGPVLPPSPPNANGPVPQNGAAPAPQGGK